MTKSSSGAAKVQQKVTHSIPSTSHEYPLMSWWAGKMSGATKLEMVGDVPVWGLEAGAAPVKFKLGPDTAPWVPHDGASAALVVMLSNKGLLEL